MMSINAVSSVQTACTMVPPADWIGQQHPSNYWAERRAAELAMLSAVLAAKKGLSVRSARGLRLARIAGGTLRDGRVPREQLSALHRHRGRRPRRELCGLMLRLRSRAGWRNA